MNKSAKILVILALIVAVFIVIILKQQNKNTDSNFSESNDTQKTNINTSEDSTQPQSLPKLVDLGADKCIPCKMMKPILDDLSENYNSKFKVIFIDVWKNQNQAQNYGVKVIPTQIFFDTSGKELFRHEGFYSKEDILNKWKELGISL